jgi:LPS-assembly lipoprotein
MNALRPHPFPKASFQSRIQVGVAGIQLLLALMVLGAAALSTSCGFKLRGAVEIPPELNPMYVREKGGSAVRKAILQRLEFSQVRLSPTADDAKVVLRIIRESRSSRVAAVDRNGKVVARELFLTVSFDAVDGAGAPIVQQNTLDLSRTYENPDVEVLGKQLESDLIYEDLVQDAADRILNRLRAALL